MLDNMRKLCYNDTIKGKERKEMSNVMIFGLILVGWALVGVAGAIFQDSFRKVNWCGIIFLFSVPFIPFVARLFGVN